MDPVALVLLCVGTLLCFAACADLNRKVKKLEADVAALKKGAPRVDRSEG